MISVFQAAVLGTVQGLTEFLPVSSSGHLVLFRHFLSLPGDFLAFDIAVHWGTLIAVFAYFSRDLFTIIRDGFCVLGRLLGGKVNAELFREFPGFRWGCLILAATFATVVPAFLFKDTLEASFGSLQVTAVCWIVIGLVLVFCSRLGVRARTPMEAMTVIQAVIIGLAQAAAILPGISRSGITICTALLLGIRKEDAARFSFLLGIPAILGAGILESGDVLELFHSSAAAALTGVLTAGAVGYLAIAILLRLIRRDKLHYFGYYCLLLGSASVLYLFLSAA